MLIVAGCASTSLGLRYDPNKLVYTSDAKGFASAELKPLFDRLLSDTKPLVLFVHGRGDEPNKSLSPARFGGHLGGGVGKLEQYGTNVVMFSWDSKAAAGNRDDRRRPLGNMPDAAKNLDTVLAALSQSVAEHANHPPVTLLAHSMGSIVVQTYLQDHSLPARVFTTVVLSSPDADRPGHRVWVDKIAPVAPVFVTANKNDIVLNKSLDAREPPSARALGLDPGSEVSQSATYIYLDDIKAHEIFTERGSHPEIARFFTSVFEGKPVALGSVEPGSGKRFHLPA
jgi:esterase/lipase superfamily enzyme